MLFISYKGGTRCWGKCGSNKKHFIRAQDLANVLKRNFKSQSLTGENFQDVLSNKKGIIFFKDYWQRPGESGRTGDHIDLWNEGTLSGSVSASPKTELFKIDTFYTLKRF